MKKFKACQAIRFNPKWKVEERPKHPLKRGDIVLFIGEIHNSPSHCVVTTYEGKVITMLHTNDFVLVSEKEL